MPDGSGKLLCGTHNLLKLWQQTGIQQAASLATVSTEAEAIVFGGNGFRAVGVIAALEHDLGRPVVTANQALLWAALRVAGADPSSVSDYGQLFDHG